MANPGTTITYNSNSLQTANILTSDINHHSGPEINAKIIEMAHANATAMPYITWPKKIVSIKGKLQNTASLSALDTLEDTFKSYLIATNANLDIGYAGSIRRYAALAVTKIALNRPQELYVCSYDVEFTCQAFGMDTSATTVVSLLSQTGATIPMTVTFSGTAPFQYPVYTFNYNSIGLSPVSGTVNIGNQVNGQTINVTRTWNNGDLLTIDTSQLLNTQGASNPVTITTATTAPAPVAFTGAFPLFAPGAATIAYSDTFSSRNVDITITNTNRYM